MIRRRAKWGIAVLVAFLSGCATGTNQRQTTRSADPATGGGLVTSRLHRDPLVARSATKRPQQASAAPASAAPDPRLSRFFPTMNARTAGAVASRPADRATSSAPSGSTRSAPSSAPSVRPSTDAPDDSLSTLPVALTVGMQQAARTPTLAGRSEMAPLSDPNVIPTAAQVSEIAPVKTPSLLPDDLSFGSRNVAEAPSAPASTAQPAAASTAAPVELPPVPLATTSADSTAPKLAQIPVDAPAPSSTPDPAAPAPQASAPSPEPAAPAVKAAVSVAEPPAADPAAPVSVAPTQYIEPMLVVSDPPRSTEPLPPPPAAPAPPAAPVPDEVPAAAPVAPLPAPGGEPALDAKAAATTPDAPPAAAAPQPVEPPMVAESNGPRNAPLPAPTLPASSSNATETPVVTPTLAVEPVSPQAPASPQSAPPVPSKQLPELSPQAEWAQSTPTAPPKLLITSLWPTWLRSGSADDSTTPPPAAAPTPAPAPAPRPALTGFWPTWSRRSTAATSSPSPRPTLASLWPTWLRPQAAPAAQPMVAAASPVAPVGPASAASPRAAVANVRPKVDHGHGCPHHVCQQGEQNTWFGVNRTLNTTTAGMFPPTYYETVIRRAGPGPGQYSVPAAPMIASAGNPAAAPPMPAPATPPAAAAPVTPPVVAAAPAAKPKRVWLITRLWNRIHGNSDDPAPSTVSPAPNGAPYSAPPAPAIANLAAAPAPARAAAAPASGNPVTGNLPQNGDAIERVSAENVNEAAQR